MHMTFTDNDLKETKSQFLGIGTHIVSIKKVEKGTSVAGNDKLIFTFSDGVRERKEHFALTPKAKWKIANLAKAIGYTEEMLKSGGIDIPTDFVGKSLELVIEEAGTETYNGTERPKWITTFNKLPQGVTAQGVTSELDLL